CFKATATTRIYTLSLHDALPILDAEGTMRGTSLAWFRKLRRATRLRITAAGGIRSRREVRALQRLGMNAAVGMALYLGKLSLGQDRKSTRLNSSHVAISYAVFCL